MWTLWSDHRKYPQRRMKMIAANTRIKLGVSKPKKDAIVAAPGTAAAASEVAIWAGSLIDPNQTQSIIGGFYQLFNYAKSNMPAIEASSATPVIVHMVLGAGDSDIEIDGTPTATEIRLEIGQDTATGSKSHFLHRTFIRLLERWLEESKSGTGSPVTAPRIVSVTGSNTHTFTGMWPGGTVINVNLVLTDPDGQTESDVFGVTLPPGDHTSAVAASVVCAEIDALVHYRCTQTGDTLTVSAAAPANTIASALTV